MCNLDLLGSVFVLTLEESLGCADGSLFVFTSGLNLKLSVKSSREQQDTQEAACVSHAVPQPQEYPGAESPEQYNETGGRSGMKPVGKTNGDPGSFDRNTEP